MSSIYSKIINNISVSISELLENISEKYSLPLEELNEMWMNESEKPKKVTKKVSPKKINSEEEKVPDPSQDKDLDPQKIINYSVSELKELCKRYNLKVSGKKDELIARLTSGDKKKEEEKKETIIDVMKKPTKKDETKDEKVLKKISPKVIVPRRNEFGNYMHAETKLVFDKITKLVIGRQMDNGEIAILNKDDIENCNKYKLAYVLPENLDSGKKGLEDVKVEELEEKKKVSPSKEIKKESPKKEEKKLEDEIFEEVEEEEEIEYEEVEEEYYEEE